MRLGMFATGAFMLATASVAQAGTLTPLFAVPSHVDGNGPHAPLVRVGPKLYGTVIQGGVNGCGAVFSVDPKIASATGRIGIVYSFTCGADGAHPSAGLALMGGKLFGVTESGGGSNDGTVFEVDPKTGTETTLYSFPTDSFSAAPLLGYHGLLYGTTFYGGVGQGSVFSVDPATGNETTVYAFEGPQSGRHDGAIPRSALIQSGGKLYGTTSQGGKAGRGVIYRLDPASGTVKTVYSFPGGTGGQDPDSPLLDVGGLLYGTSQGGSAGDGLVFSFDPSTGTERDVYSFTGATDGAYLTAGLTSLNGLLYGLDRSGGQYGDGVLFSIDPASGNETTLHAFTIAEGSDSDGGLIAYGGILYGAQQFGGTYGEFGPGTVFAFNPNTAQVTTLHSFSDAPISAGSAVIDVGSALYGVSQTGGAFGFGSIFRVDRATGEGKVVYSFSGKSDGYAPLAALTELGGMLYGTTVGGGVNSYGTVFAFDPASKGFRTLYAFAGGSDGLSPTAVLTAVGGVLYGTTYSGGASGLGTVFTVDPSTGAETVVYSFGKRGDGYSPEGGVVVANGLLYGVTRAGGAASCGTIYDVDPASGREAVLYSFTGDTECSPLVAPVLLDGKLYGVTAGDRGGKGAFYGFDPASETVAVLHSFKKGETPSASLTAVGNHLYGVVGQCCTYGEGSLVSIDANTGRTDTLYSFTGGSDGSFPRSTLVHADGAFYGTSSLAQSAGLVFKFTP